MHIIRENAPLFYPTVTATPGKFGEGRIISGRLIAEPAPLLHSVVARETLSIEEKGK